MDKISSESFELLVSAPLPESDEESMISFNNNYENDLFPENLPEEMSQDDPESSDDGKKEDNEEVESADDDSASSVSQDNEEVESADDDSASSVSTDNQEDIEREQVIAELLRNQQGPVILSGVMFDGLRPIPYDPRIDPPLKHCFNCWVSGHPRKHCPVREKRLCCFNCGRSGVTLNDCPRCWEANLRGKNERIAERRRRNSYPGGPPGSRDRRVPSPERVLPDPVMEVAQEAAAAVVPVEQVPRGVQPRLRYETSEYEELQANAMLALDSVFSYAKGLNTRDRARLEYVFMERMDSLSRPPQ